MSDKWYGRMHDMPGVRVQIESIIRDNKPFTLPESIVRAAAAEYNRQGYNQSYEVLQQRGGLGVMEVIALLADALKIEVPISSKDDVKIS